jgi:hypothetical protein
MVRDEQASVAVGPEASQSRPLVPADTTEAVTEKSAPAEQEAATAGPDDAVRELPSSRISGWSTTIVAVDRKDHLIGLKRQRGGIGRIAHDDSQKKLTGFFKKQRTS